MLAFPTYLSHGGTLPEAKFALALPGANATVRAMTHPNVPQSDEQLAAYDSAVTALIERHAHPERDATSEKVGETAVSFGAGGSRGLTDEQFVRPYLVGTGLLYRGI